MSSRIGPDYFYELVSVSSPDLSCDGSRIAFVRSTVDRESAETSSQIFVEDMTDGSRISTVGGARVFTSGPKDALPRWSPDAANLAFLRGDDRGKSQLWVIPSQMGEGVRIADQPSGITDFWWSPDSARIAFQAVVDPRNADSNGSLQPITVTRLRYKADGIGLRGDSRVHLFVVNVATRESAQITSGEFDNYAAAWSPDGARVAFISSRHEQRDTEARTEAYVVGVDGGVPESWSDGLYAVGGITWSPDGNRLAVIGTPALAEGGGCSLTCQSWIYILEPNERPRRITDDSIAPESGAIANWSGGKLRWPEGDEIVFQGEARGQSYICAARVDGRGVRRLTSGGAQISDWGADRAARSAVVASVGPASASDIASIDLATGEETRLTAYNDEWFAQHPPASLEKFTFERSGMEIEARLWFPPDFDPSSRYPLVLDVHGGPHSVFFDAFYALHQLPASAGYVVLAINPRGSGTYGLDFATAVHGDWAGEPFEDLMHGLDLVMKRPYIDETRVVMHGSSYGGYMGAWIAAHTDRFKAIVIAAPVTSLPSLYGTSDIGVHFSEIQLRGGLWDDPSTLRRSSPRWRGKEAGQTGSGRGFEEYVRQSPLTYAPNVSTPVLILHGEDDARVPIEQGEQFFVALKRLGKEVEFVRLPGSYHGLMRNPDLRMRTAYFERVLGWFEKHLTG